MNFWQQTALVLFLVIPQPSLSLAQVDSSRCIRSNFKRASALAAANLARQAELHYRKALQCKGSSKQPRLTRFVRAHLATFYLKNQRCKPCAIHQYCSIHAKAPAKYRLPSITTPSGLRIYRRIKAGKLTCPKRAQDLQKNAYVLTNTRNKKRHTSLKISIRASKIRSVRVLYSVPWVARQMKKHKNCPVSRCSISISVPSAHKGKALDLRYHYQLHASSSNIQIQYAPNGKAFRKVMVPQKYYDDARCKALPNSPQNAGNDREALREWLQKCRKLRAGKKFPTWAWVVIAGVGGAAVGALTTFFIMNAR